MKRDNSINLTCREAILTPASVNEEDYSVEAIVATDRVVTVLDGANYRVIDEILVAGGGDFPPDVPLLDSHNRSGCEGVYGSATQFKREGTQWLGRAVFDSEDEDALKIYRKVKKGFIKAVSIGYRVLDAIEIRPGETARVDGKEYTASPYRVLRIAKRWRVRELSVTPIGADEAAQFRDGVEVLKGLEVTKMNKRLLAYLRRLGLAEGATDEQARQFAGTLTGHQRTIAAVLDYAENDEAARTSADQMIRSAGFDPAEPWNQERKAAGNDGATLISARELTSPIDYARIERDRIEAIRSIAEISDIADDVVRTAIDESWDVATFNRRAVDDVKKRRKDPVAPDATPAIHVRGNEDKDTRKLALLSAVMERNDLNVVENFVEYSDTDYMVSKRGNVNNDQLQKAADLSQKYRDMSLIDVMRQCCEWDGINVGYNRTEIIQRAFSSATLQYVFTQNFSAQLIAGYEGVMDTTGPFTSSGTLPDFKLTERTRMKKGDKLSKLARGKEAQHVERADFQEQYRLSRYAAQFVVDEQDLIDDRFGAIESSTPRELGEAAAELRPDLVYSVLLANAAMSDTVALFHADHGNLSTSLAFSPANLETAIELFSVQTENGRILNAGKTIVLLVPSALRYSAKRAIKSPSRSEDSDAGTMNPLYDEPIQLISDARLQLGLTDPSSGTVLAGSSTTWYLIAGNRHTIEVGTLRGSSGRPSIRPFTLTEGKWGMGWDIKMDIGAKALDWLGMRKHTAG